MQLGIRTKLTSILVLAAVLPLFIALVALQTFGYRQRVSEKGASYANEALLLADNLRTVTENHIDALRDFLRLRNVADLLDPINRELASLDSTALTNHIMRLEGLWPSLGPDHPDLQPLLTNALSRELRVFLEDHPAFAEILVADRAGRLAGATGKTTDYYQADEGWWQQGFQLTEGQGWLEGLNYDASAAVFSLDIALPIRARNDTASEPCGVVKAVLNATSLFTSIPFHATEDSPIREVVRTNGQILLRLLDESFQPRSEALPYETSTQLNTSQPGWFITRLHQGQTQMIGHAPLPLAGVLPPDRSPETASSLHVVVHRETSIVLAPIRRQTLLLTALGLLGALACLIAGLTVAQIKLVRPIQALRSAAHALAETVRQDSSAPGRQARSTTPRAHQLLASLKHIRTGDEIETLSDDFRRMASQILGYQRHLQDEVASKTAEIQRDLEMAREFQEALLPSTYPEVPTPGTPSRFAFRFHHAYRPTFTVSGDFFDLIPLSPHRVGLLMADVMGHGSRSALVTSIARTLARELLRQTTTPAAFLRQLNEHFLAVLGQTRQTLFVTMLFAIADANTGSLEIASAGHPSPLLLNRSSGTVNTIFSHLNHNPALGLVSNATYTTFRHPLAPDDVLLLLTDGALEAPTPDGSDVFGEDRLRLALQNHRNRTLRGLLDGILHAIDAFAGQVTLPDDVCLLAMEVIRNSTSPTPR